MRFVVGLLQLIERLKENSGSGPLLILRRARSEPISQKYGNHDEEQADDPELHLPGEAFIGFGQLATPWTLPESSPFE